MKPHWKPHHPYPVKMVWNSCSGEETRENADEKYKGFGTFRILELNLNFVDIERTVC